MTKKEIILNTIWDEFEMGTCRLFVDVLDQYIPVVFFQDHKPSPDISDKMIRSINDILALDKNELDTLKEILYTSYLSVLTDGDNGDESSMLNREELYLNNKVKEIHIDQDNDRFNGVYSEIIMSSVSNNLINIIVKDAKIICLDDGTYFDLLEED